MFSTSTVFHFKVLVPEHNTAKIVLELQKSGTCQLKESEGKIGRQAELELSDRIFETSNRLENIRAIASHFYSEEQPAGQLKEIFFPGKKKKIKFNLLSNRGIIEKITASMSEMEQWLFPRNSELELLKKNFDANNEIKNRLWFFPESFRAEHLQSTENILCMPGLVDAKKLDDLLKKKIEWAISVSGKGNNTKAIAAYMLHSKKDDAARALGEAGFEPVELPAKKGAISDITKKIERENSEIGKKISLLEQELKGWTTKNVEVLLELEKALSASLDRIRAFKVFRKSEFIAIFEAWVPEKDRAKFLEALGNASKYYIESEERDNAPTIYENHPLIRPFELITNMYSPPRYKGIDPTPVLAFFFCLFFGFMLTDFFYGVIVAAIGYGIYNGKGREDRTMHDFGKIIFWAGIFTAVLGAVFGSYFGNFLSNIGIKIPFVWDTMNDAMAVIILSLIIAVLHSIIALVLGFYDNVFNRKNFLRGMLDQGVWLMFMAGIFLLILQLQPLFYIGLSLIGLSVILLVALKAKLNGAPVAVLSILDIPSFFGDILSYIRLTAYAVGTSGIALAVNFLVSLSAGIPYIGIIIAILVFVVGHSFNIAMNFLGAFINAMRLHFLEFFKKFYEGGGSVYEPFKLKEQ